jgi:hypothetical protein
MEGGKAVVQAHSYEYSVNSGNQVGPINDHERTCERQFFQDFIKQFCSYEYKYLPLHWHGCSPTVCTFNCALEYSSSFNVIRNSLWRDQSVEVHDLKNHKRISSMQWHGRCTSRPSFARTIIPFFFSSLQPPCTSVGNVASWKLGHDDPLVLWQYGMLEPRASWKSEVRFARMPFSQIYFKSRRRS